MLKTPFESVRTSNRCNDEKVAKSRRSSEGDGGRRKHVGGVHNEQNQADKKSDLIYIYVCTMYMKV